MSRNECLDAALHELSRAGIRDVVRSYGSKHLQLRWQVNGTERMCTLPVTPSDVRSVDNTRAIVRRLLREDGVLLPTEHKPPAPRPLDKLTLLERRITALEQRLLILAALEQRLLILEQRQSSLAND